MARSQLGPPPPRTGELMRAAASVALRDDTVYVDVDQLGVLTPAIVADPTLAEAMVATTRDNVLHWLSRIAVDPFEPVAPAHSPTAVAFARDLVRRGYDTTALTTYLSGQNAAWQNWMPICFAVTDDPEELKSLLSYSAASIFAYVEATIADLGNLVRAQRQLLARGSDARQIDLVAAVLRGAEPADTRTTGLQLGHDLRRPQTALIVWGDASTLAEHELERAAQVVGARAGAGPAAGGGQPTRPLVVVASTGSVWAWCATAQPPDLAAMRAAVAGVPGVRVAVGSTAAGIAGFRQSHHDARTVQRVMSRVPRGPRLATYDDVRVAAFITDDAERAAAFVARALGPLARADDDLLDTLRTYQLAGGSTAQTARLLHTHRNTVLNRLAKIRTLLPLDPDVQGLEIALALEILKWSDGPASPRRP